MEGQLIASHNIPEIAELIRHRRKNGLWQAGDAPTSPRFEAARILVKNTESEQIPAYGCMQIDGTVYEDSRLYFKVKKPTTAGRDYLFNAQYAIESLGYGTAQTGPLVRAYKSTGTVTYKNLWRPTTGQWYLTLGSGRYPAMGTDDIDDNVFWVRTDFSDIIHFKSQAGGIPAISTLTMGSATCDRYDSTTGGVLSDSGEDVTIYNDGVAFPASSIGTAKLNDAGLWVIDGRGSSGGIINIRLSGSNFQYTFDNSTWTTWTTGTACP